MNHSSALLTIRGDFGSLTGAGFAAYALCDSLLKTGISVRVEPTGPVRQAFLTGLVAERFSETQNRPRGKIVLHLHAPPWEIDLMDFNVGWALANSPVPNHQFKQHWDRCDLVITPSRKLQHSYAGQATRTQYACLPLPLQIDEIERVDEPLPLIGTTHSFCGEQLASVPFVFGTVGSWVPRSGTEELVRAFVTAFSARDNVTLVIMLGAPGPKSAVLEEGLAVVHAVVKKRCKKDPPKIRLIVDELTAPEYYSLLRVHA